MTLSEVFSMVRPAVVAFMPTVIRVAKGSNPPELLPIIGTGFILDDGLVVTNAHVVDELLRIPIPPDWPKGKWPFSACLFHYLDKNRHPRIPSEGIARIPLEVLGLFRVGDLQLGERGIYYGPRRPDFNIIHVKAKGLPKVELLPDTDALREGVEIATIGFPMGREALTAPGWLHQFGPFLQRGVISAILPFVCKAPHSIVVNLMSLPGASGSPVFLSGTPRAIGILNAGLAQNSLTIGSVNGKLAEIGMTRTSTDFSYVVPAYFLSNCLESIRSNPTFALPKDTLSLDAIVDNSQIEVAKEPGHNEPPDPNKLLIPGGDAPTIEVHIEPSSKREESG